MNRIYCSFFRRPFFSSLLHARITATSLFHDDMTSVRIKSMKRGVFPLKLTINRFLLDASSSGRSSSDHSEIRRRFPNRLILIRTSASLRCVNTLPNSAAIGKTTRIPFRHIVSEVCCFSTLHCIALQVSTRVTRTPS